MVNGEKEVYTRDEQEENNEYISKGGTEEGLVKHLSTSIDAITD